MSAMDGYRTNPLDGHSWIGAPAFRMPITSTDAAGAAALAARALPQGGVFYYALGGGLGHLTRAEAIHRAFRRRSNEPFVVLDNCRVAARVTSPRLVLEDRPDSSALAALISALLSSLKPKALVVDAFPAGILGELASLLGQTEPVKLAVVRRLRAEWVERWNLTELVPRAYHRVLYVEPGSELPGLEPLPSARRVPPVLVREPDEVLSRKEARRILDIPDETLAVAAVVSELTPAAQGLLSAAARAAERATAGAAWFRVVSPQPVARFAEQRLEHFPLMEWMRAFDVVVGGSGYHLCHETDALGVPAVLVPQVRRYDDQFARAAGRRVASSPEALEQEICRIARERRSDSAENPPGRPSGAGEAAGEIIAALAGSGAA